MTMKTEAKNPYKKGLWTVEEDKLLMDYVELHGKGQWNKIPDRTGLKRCGKSCRLRWMNYLSPNVKKGDFSEEEEDLIIRLHKLLGNRWSLIAKRVPGRTDNQVKNYWNSHLSKKLGIKDLNRKRVDSCQSSKQVKVPDHEAAIDDNPTPGDDAIATIKGTMEIAVDDDQSGSQQQQAIDQVLNTTTQESVMNSDIFMNNFWISDDDFGAKYIYFDGCSSFDLA